jgi:hypothetical protein
MWLTHRLSLPCALLYAARRPGRNLALPQAHDAAQRARV